MACRTEGARRALQQRRPAHGHRHAWRVLDDPHASSVSVTAIADVVEAVRTGSPLRAS
jgi:hypothetical protein